jgi:hypothetical protein
MLRTFTTLSDSSQTSSQAPAYSSFANCLAWSPAPAPQVLDGKTVLLDGTDNQQLALDAAAAAGLGSSPRNGTTTSHTSLQQQQQQRGSLQGGSGREAGAEPLYGPLGGALVTEGEFMTTFDPSRWVGGVR